MKTFDATSLVAAERQGPPNGPVEGDALTCRASPLKKQSPGLFFHSPLADAPSILFRFSLKAVKSDQRLCLWIPAGSERLPAPRNYFFRYPHLTTTKKSASPDIRTYAFATRQFPFYHFSLTLSMVSFDKFFPQKSRLSLPFCQPNTGPSLRKTAKDRHFSAPDKATHRPLCRSAMLTIKVF